MVQQAKEGEMKHMTVFLCAGILLLSGTAFARGDSDLPKNVNWDVVEQNLLVGLQSDNLGLQRSCALMLGKIKAHNSVIPLMRVLRTESDEGLRAAAAWALCQIGSSVGTYAVKQTAVFDNCCKVKALCAWYYNTYVQSGTFAFIEPESSVIAAALSMQ
jgi:hypothetical protein